MWAKRIQKEIKDLVENPEELNKEGIALIPDESNIQHFQQHRKLPPRLDLFSP